MYSFKQILQEEATQPKIQKELVTRENGSKYTIYTIKGFPGEFTSENQAKATWNAHRNPSGPTYNELETERLSSQRKAADTGYNLEADIKKSMTQMLAIAGITVAGGVGLASIGGFGGLLAKGSTIFAKFGITNLAKGALGGILSEITDLINSIFGDEAKKGTKENSEEMTSLQFDLKNIIQKAQQSDNQYSMKVINSIKPLIQQDKNIKESILSFGEILREADFSNRDWMMYDEPTNTTPQPSTQPFPTSTMSQGPVTYKMPDGKNITTANSEQIEQLIQQGGVFQPKATPIFQNPLNNGGVFITPEARDTFHEIGGEVLDGLGKALSMGLIGLGAYQLLKDKVEDPQGQQLQLKIQKLEQGLNNNLKFDIKNLYQKINKSDDPHKKQISAVLRTLI